MTSMEFHDSMMNGINNDIIGLLCSDMQPAQSEEPQPIVIQAERDLHKPKRMPKTEAEIQHRKYVKQTKTAQQEHDERIAKRRKTGAKKSK